ncbi:MAG: efflux RND transporter periplasmic adaptor subunit, partial [Verrucomicrobiota bacterium]
MIDFSLLVFQRGLPQSIRRMPLVLGLVVLVMSSCREQRGQEGGAPPAMPVRVQSPVQKEVKLTETYTGRFVPIESVELRARVSGYVESVHFVEGQRVEEGDLMFQIDPRPFDARLAAAEAGTKETEARLSLAESNMKRADRLVESNAISTQDAEIRRSEFAQAEADLLAAKAAEQSAKLDREFADVRAPIE